MLAKKISRFSFFGPNYEMSLTEVKWTEIKSNYKRILADLN